MRAFLSHRSALGALAIGILLTVLAVFYFETPSCAQAASECGCGEPVPECKTKPTPTPSVSPTPKKRPLPPIKRRAVKHVYEQPVRFIGDKDLPGLDFGSGTALDVGDNYEQGRRWDRESAYTGVGHFTERRLFIQRTVEYARTKAAAGEIPQSNVTRIIEIMKEKLERTNEQERAAYREALGEEFDAYLEDLQTNVEAQNAQRAADMEKVIEKMDLDNYDSLEDAIAQIVSENLQQARELELTGNSGLTAQQRAFSLLDKVYARFAKDCDKKKVKTSTILAIERTAQLMGGAGSEVMDKCFSVTAVAKVSLPAFEFEAKKCVNPILKGKARFDGEWVISVVGPVPYRGTANISNNGADGNWKATASIGERGATVDLDANGEAEIISSGGACLLWLKPGDSKGLGQSEQYSILQKLATPLHGKFAIKIVPEVCNIKKPTSN